jgi:hypothetical protein
MGRKQVVEIQCSRCSRTETQEGKLETTPPHVFSATLLFGEADTTRVEVKFEDLCTPCRRTVNALLGQIAKRIEGVSPDRKLKPKDDKPKPEAKGKGPPANGGAPHHAQPASAAPVKGARSPA